MTLTAQASSATSAAQTHEQEALLLVELLRTSRLSLLFCQAGAHKTDFLNFGLTPLLCRRTGDRPAPVDLRTFGIVVPFPDRRSRHSILSSKRRRELVVYCGDWTGTPLDALRAALYKALDIHADAVVGPTARLADLLQDLSRRLDAHFVILLDRFEDVLQGASEQAVIDELVEELAEAINQVQIPANFLISLDEVASPRLAGLRSRIPGFDDFSLRLAPPRNLGEALAPVSFREPLASASIDARPIATGTRVSPADSGNLSPLASPAPPTRTSGKTKVKKPPLPRVEVTVANVYAMIEAALSDIAASATVGSFPSDAGEPSGCADIARSVVGVRGGDLGRPS